MNGKLFQRVLAARKKHGSLGLVRCAVNYKCPIQIRLVFQKAAIAAAGSVPGLAVERYRSRNLIDPVLLNMQAELKDGRILQQANKLFLKKCELWIGQIDGRIAGMCWSRSGERRSDYFVPLNETDATILSCYVFPQFRGQGIYPTMLQTMVNTLMQQDQIRNVYIDVMSWNIPSVRGVKKAGFIPFGKALCLVLFDKIWILHNKCNRLSQESM